ncbi:MAG: hypothetical protein R3C15_07875 [Thermoleophilia bacterium]
MRDYLLEFVEARLNEARAECGDAVSDCCLRAQVQGEIADRPEFGYVRTRGFWINLEAGGRDGCETCRKFDWAEGTFPCLFSETESRLIVGSQMCYP